MLSTIIGLIAGFISRAIVPGRQHMGIRATILLGIIGSFVGGFVQPSSWIGSITGAVIVLLIDLSVRDRNRA